MHRASGKVDDVAKLTKRFVDGLKSSASGGDFVVFDEDLACFGM